MTREERTKKRLLLAFEISKLYVKTGLSTQELSNFTGVPKASIKRYTNMISTRRAEYLSNFPELMTEDEIDLFIQYIEKRHRLNKKTNRWNSGENNSDLNSIAIDIGKIQKLYREIDMKISLKKKAKMKQMRDDGMSYRDIASKNGTSLSHTHKTITDMMELEENISNENQSGDKNIGGRHR